jgi:hypothetical protein
MPNPEEEIIEESIPIRGNLWGTQKASIACHYCRSQGNYDLTIKSTLGLTLLVSLGEGFRDTCIDITQVIGWPDLEDIVGDVRSDLGDKDPDKHEKQKRDEYEGI